MIRATLEQARYFVLQKNYLAAHKAASVQELTEALVGLPAEPWQTTYLSAWARMGYNFSADHLTTQHIDMKTLVYSILMRSSPYLAPSAQLATLLAATARQRTQALNARLRQWGLETNEEIERLASLMMSVMGKEPTSAEALAGGLSSERSRELTQTSRGGRVSTTTTLKLALHWLVVNGQLTQTQAPGSPWWQNAPLYVPLPRKISGLGSREESPDEGDAQKALVRAYIAAFGPVTEADISAWTGFSKAETARATGALSNETGLAKVEGLPGMLLLLKSQSQALHSLQLPHLPMINLLPANDPYITAYRASRSRYVANKKLERRVFGSGGAVQPTIVVNGQIVGTWEWQPNPETTHHHLTWQLFDDVEIETEAGSALMRHLEELAGFLPPDTEVRHADDAESASNK